MNGRIYVQPSWAVQCGNDCGQFGDAYVSSRAKVPGELRRLGWRLLGGLWHCPVCAKNTTERRTKRKANK